MFEIVTLIILALLATSGYAEETNSLLENNSQENNRQRRLLFYDEQGNLVKTYSNPYINDFSGKENSILWNVKNPFFSFIRPSSFSGSSIAYMIPISEEVVQQINNDPVYQNKLLFLTTRDPAVKINPLCNGKREPIPSPEKCYKFLNCWDGWASEEECPDGLMFSNNGYCDYSFNVDCANRKVKDIIEPRCRQDFLTFRNETNCNEFFVCINGLPVRFKCPSDLHYSTCRGVCEFKETANCNSSSISDPVTTENAPPATMTSPTSSASSSTKDPTPIEQSTASIVSNPKPVFVNTFYDSKTWTSTHVAMSRQDAIRQLKLKSIADVKTAE
ncbi:uncharacterized protein [Battus philenor]|uniref:uncharacterized protein n=1 Tax=Battus philenor TaxID=42288 RepID=UPI0035D1317D